MEFTTNGFSLALDFYIRTETEEYSAVPIESRSGFYEYKNEKVYFKFLLNSDYSYSLNITSVAPVSIKIALRLIDEDGLYHLIPCNIHGDNNLAKAKPGFFPNLTFDYPESDSTSPEWEFRADRASHPVSIVTCKRGAVGISINPYSDNSPDALSDNSSNEISFIRNGVFSKLPDTAGVSLGYRNFPYTFIFKEMMSPQTAHYTKNAQAAGKIFAIEGNGRLASADIIRKLYSESRECPLPEHNVKSYLEGFLDSYENINWSDDLNAFTNEDCMLPDSPELKPWRPLIAIGWTGIGVLIYPLLSAQLLTGQKNDFTEKMKGLFDEMADRINPATGLFYDLIRPWNDSDVNGWWAGYMVKDCHCAYTNGNGTYYLLKTYELLKKTTGEEKRKWLESALTALDSAISMQRNDGCYGYTFSQMKPEVLDFDGFAGCWFAAACALAYKITGENAYLVSAEKGAEYYFKYIKNLDCWGSPMDTWKSIDQEGNLAFIRTAVILHSNTGNPKYLQMAVHSAEYEYLWRYSFKARPEFRPLKNSNWNSCGGSVTSVSNPHIHPMGVNITAELIYIYKNTGDKYHLNRAVDGLFWGLATADMYPKTTGYGQLGVITERYCPSDGLTIEKYSDTGERSSIWFTFNGWAGVSILEGLTETLFKAGLYNSNLTLDITEIFNYFKAEEKT